MFYFLHQNFNKVNFFFIFILLEECFSHVFHFNENSIIFLSLNIRGKVEIFDFPIEKESL